MNNIDKEYQILLEYILGNGHEKKDRTGIGTLSTFGWQIRHKMSEGFPLLTTKRMYWKGIVTELLWFLRGDTNIKYLVDNDCHIWDGDAYKRYKIWADDLSKTHKYLPYTKEQFINKIKTDDEFTKKWGELGPIYGKMWRDWDEDTGVKIDQISNLIEQLKTNPDSRRLMVNAWNPTYLPQMTLPPCHYGFQVYTRELSYDEKVHEARKRFGFELEDGTRTFDINTKESIEFLNSTQRAISLMWNQRSVDTFLGLPFNITSYGLLLEIIAKEVNMVPDELIGNLGDVHLYKNHVEQAKEQLSEIPWKERKEMLTDPNDIRSFGDISPFTDKVINYWLDLRKIPYSRRMPFPLPTLEIIEREEQNFSMDEMYIDNFQFPNYQSHSTIKAPLNN